MSESETMSAAANPTTDAPATIYLADYSQPAFQVEHIELDFRLHEEFARVRSTMQVRRNPGADGDSLALDGEDLVLIEVSVDGRRLAESEYELDDATLRLDAPGDAFVVSIETELRPQENTQLSGLYRSSGNFCTQCEAEGFRRITFFPDRPDVMSIYRTRIEADRDTCPVLLSNGNLVGQGDAADGRHWALWEDPFPKPSYLFALVAGDLASIQDQFTTASGRDVELFVYVQAHNKDKCDHAMASLKRAMRWDEEVYGREYDLERYMIVAVDDFNMGAMENKGLNIFNSKYVLARPETATDRDYHAIEGVIGHEYFHNWSGNRVTCRDWFQLSLKEGFTVFRDQEFSADLGSRAVERIDNVNILRSNQFREDAGPMAHPVRPESYVEINNFYTLTVYNKGAEVVRMLHTLLGAEQFRAATDLYFERHDGQAVTTDDFVCAMEDATGKDLQQFRRWYEQAGTPRLQVEGEYDADHKSYRLRVRQSCPPTPGQTQKEPFHIPLAMGLVGPDGQDYPLRLVGEQDTGATTRVLELRAAEQLFVFVDIPQAPIPSLLRGFSAPVRLQMERSDQDLAFLMGHDSDGFARWDAGQELMMRALRTLVAQFRHEQQPQVSEDLLQACGRILDDEDTDPALRAEALQLPSENLIAEDMAVIDPVAVHKARLHLRLCLAERLRGRLLAHYDALADDAPYSIDAAAMGRRALRNLCLSYLMELDEPEILRRCRQQFEQGSNMTDVIAALGCLVNADQESRDQALQAYYEQWRDEPLVVDKWLMLQACSRAEDTVERVRGLSVHPAFSLTNPNKVYALIRAFAAQNPYHFHAESGAGYRFVAEQVAKLDPLNPQVAARVVSVFSQWRRYDTQRQALMRKELEGLLEQAGLSRDSYEVISKSLQAG